MIDVFQKTLTIYKNYGGESMMTLSLTAALLFLWILEDRKDIRALFVYLSAAVGGLFFFPPFAYAAMRFFLDGEIYYRLLWLIPSGMIVSYGIVKILGAIPQKRKRLAAGALFAWFLIWGGSLIYQNELVKPAENLYHLPKEDIAVADVMHVEGRDVKAVVPGELLQFIRQYDASIQLAYGRDALVEGWSSNPLYEAMEANPVRSFAITDYAKQQGVEYIVLRAGTPIVGTKPIEKYEFSYLTTTENYDIYIYDRAEFAEEKKEQYRSLADPDWEENYMRTE